MNKKDLAIELYKSFKKGVIKKSNKPPEIRNNIATDPQLIGSVLDNLINERDWHSGVAEGNLFTSWQLIVGVEIANHSTPLSINSGNLVIQTTSTAWATQLSLASNEVLETIQKNAPLANILSLQIVGPAAPSWKRGIRTTRDARGPRDTFG